MRRLLDFVLFGRRPAARAPEAVADVANSGTGSTAIEPSRSTLETSLIAQGIDPERVARFAARGGLTTSSLEVVSFVEQQWASEGFAVRRMTLPDELPPPDGLIAFFDQVSRLALICNAAPLDDRIRDFAWGVRANCEERRLRVVAHGRVPEDIPTEIGINLPWVEPDRFIR